MNKKSIVNKIKVLLNVNTELAQYTDAEGTVFEAESLEAGQVLSLVTPDGQVAADPGKYRFGDKEVLVIEGGVIEEVIDLEVESELETTTEETPAEETTEVEATEEVKPALLATILEVNKWALDVDNTNFAVGETVKVTYEDGKAYPITAGEYILENGDSIQVDSEGKIVLVTPKEVETVTASEDVPETVTLEVHNALLQRVTDLEEVVETLTDALASFRLEQTDEVELEEATPFIPKPRAQKVEASEQNELPRTQPNSTVDRVFKNMQFTDA